MLETFKSSYKTLIFGQTEFSNLINQLIGDPSNQEAVQMLATFDQKVQKMSVSEAITFFRSKEGADEIAKVLVVLKQVYDRFMQKGEFEFIPKSSHKFLSI
jgi:CRISPR/Cas system endoribonuclease Cas6 (RAMP superfamily)